MTYDSDRRSSSSSGDRSGGRGAPRGRGMPLSELDPALTGASHKLIGCARDVHVALGPGYDREVYLEALKAEMTAQGVAFRAAHRFPVLYKGQTVGQAVPDLFVSDRFLVNVLATPGEVGGYERAQLRAQLKAADLELGLIINFAGRLLKDGLVRVLNLDKIQAMKGEGHPPEGEGEDHPQDDFGESEHDARP
jgi:GxxExxY protein